MSVSPQKVFDDRPLMALGIPVISLIVVVFFLKETPNSVGWNFFLITWMISALYTSTYWFLSRWIIGLWRKKCPGITHTTKRIFKTLFSLISLVILFETLCFYYVSWEDLFRTVDENTKSILDTGPISLILVIGMVGLYEAIYFFSLYRKAELDKERLLRSQVENQLDALRKQVDPHFLFNSLNTLAAIIPENPVAAQQFTERLSATYRRLLEWRHMGTVTLAQELEALKDYLHLLEVRFEDRLQVDLNIDPTMLDFYVVPLALQLLVENAVKHNEASIAHPLVVHIYTEGQQLVVNNLMRLKAKNEVESTGYGLENLRDRVRYLCKQELQLSTGPTSFEVRIPLLEMAGYQAVQTLEERKQ